MTAILLSIYLGTAAFGAVREYFDPKSFDARLFYPTLCALFISTSNTCFVVGERVIDRASLPRCLRGFRDMSYVLRCILPVLVWYHLTVLGGFLIPRCFYVLFYLDTSLFLGILLFGLLIECRSPKTRLLLPGASVARILTFRTYMDARLHDFQSSCPICLDTFHPQEQLWILACTHLFHSACLQQWFRIRSACPTCRLPVSGRPG